MAAKPQPMCAVTIGFETYLLPATAGMKLVDLMQQAMTCERDFGIGSGVTATGPVEVLYRSIRADQITMPPGSEVTPASPSSTRKRIGKHPLRLTEKP